MTPLFQNPESIDMETREESLKQLLFSFSFGVLLDY